MDLLHTLLIVCPLIFLASFIDSIAGGGGLISLPAFLLTGMPTHTAYGCNKFSATMGTSFAVARFLKSGVVHLRTALISACFALIGSSIGARLTLLLSDYALRLVMTILLPIMAIFILCNKNSMKDENNFDKLSDKLAIFLSGIIGLCIGTYDGFFGPGTGTFLIIAYTTLMGFDFKTACGNAKIVNLASNLAAMLVFLTSGKVFLAVAVPASMFSILGGWLGSGLAIKKGAKFIRPVLVFVLFCLFSKIIYDTIF